eukprot:TRINITY_DN13016_c0_g1_i1.p1 TRINITY_DN13016_c0_g1~~TRINITY_DN13016_c0_g1_i1.p1  ORF type:complete len:231 (+),score=23.37 TRINITY_DN13016_c0_g1_i1:202-894(+)
MHLTLQVLLAATTLCIAIPVPEQRVLDCPSSDPCVGCNSSRSYMCVSIPAHHHDPALLDQAALVKAGYKGLGRVNSLRYSVVFHPSTLTYPCGSWCSNENKLFGFSRGTTPVMSQSCMFGWRKSYQPGEPQGTVKVWGYGWFNSSMKPWEHPLQNPDMGFFNTSTEYVFELVSNPLNCTYTIREPSSWQVVASASTPQLPPRKGPSYYFNLYFGGEETTTQPVTVSYSKI